MGCCLGGCVRLLGYWLWRALFAAALAMVFARVDDYVDRTGQGDSIGGKAWRAYRRGKGRRAGRGTPPPGGKVIDTQGRPRP